MGRIIFVAAALLLGGWSSGALARTSPEFIGAQGIAEIWRNALVANDLDAIVACYESEASLWLPGTPAARGIDRIRQAYAALLDLNTVKDVTFANTYYETVESLSAGWGNVFLTLIPKLGGAPLRMDARFSVVAARVSGRWVYIHDHISSGACTDDNAQSVGTTGKPACESLLPSGTLPAAGQPSEHPVPPADIKPPWRISLVAPKYPSGARRRGTEGIVVLEVVVNEMGNVENPRVIESNPIFDDAAVEAVSQWKYKPALDNGKPFKFYVRVIVEFNLK